MKNIIKKISKLKTLETSIGAKQIQALAIKLSDEYEKEKELENDLLLFFSLNSKDVENLLVNLRKASLKTLEDEKGIEFLKKNEKQISEMIKQLNKHSLKEHNEPFHLSAAKGDLKMSEKIASTIGLKLSSIPGIEASTAKSGSCPFGNYPRYVGKKFPWKLRLSFKTRTYQRREDSGCHFQHGPFNGTIKGWVSFFPQVMIMVLLQGWGFKLAANNNHFFYKWWFVLAVGLTPYACQYLLWARKY